MHNIIKLASLQLNKSNDIIGIPKKKRILYVKQYIPSKVFPVPGGPYSRTPLGALIPSHES